MVLAENTREGFSENHMGFKLDPWTLWGLYVPSDPCWYHSVSAKMTRVLAALGNLPLTSIILVKVSGLVCQMA